MVRLTVSEASKRLGVNADTIRRRIRRGELSGFQEQRPQGFVWMVEFPDDNLPGVRIINDALNGDSAPSALVDNAEDALHRIQKLRGEIEYFSSPTSRLRSDETATKLDQLSDEFLAASNRLKETGVALKETGAARILESQRGIAQGLISVLEVVPDLEREVSRVNRLAFATLATVIALGSALIVIVVLGI